MPELGKARQKRLSFRLSTKVCGLLTPSCGKGLFPVFAAKVGREKRVTILGKRLQWRFVLDRLKSGSFKIQSWNKATVDAHGIVVYILDYLHSCNNCAYMGMALRKNVV